MPADAPMIITRLIGGLGNQLFQYAAARALAIRHGARVKLDLSSFETYGLRRYELDVFPIEADIVTMQELALVVPPGEPSGLFARIAVRFKSCAPHHYREAHYHFDAGLAEQRPPLLMEGYWQSQQYFVDAASALRRELTPRDPMEPENRAFADVISATEAVSLHVRRGDYVSNAHTNTYHGVCSLDYYRAAIKHVARKTTAPHLFVFSDDHDWTRENLKSDLPTTYVAANPADRGFRDMQLMSLCQHHIIANSSFSWWGAWLNPSPEKIVVAPARWFAAGDNDTRDLLPPDWVKL